MVRRSLSAVFSSIKVAIILRLFCAINVARFNHEQFLDFCLNVKKFSVLFQRF